MMKLRTEPHLLVLGSGDSGKTTFMKQIRIIHGGGYQEYERKAFREHIIENIRDSILRLIAGVKQNSSDDDLGSVKAHLALFNISASQDKISEIVEYYRNEASGNSTVLSPGIAKIVEEVWADQEVQATLLRIDARSISMQDTAGYFLERATKLADPSYLPDQEDILRVRSPTTQITEMCFKIENKMFHFFDVGGQQKHRKQWAPYFDKMHTVLFIVSLASYDQNLVEDPTINRMHDALQLFGDVCNNSLLKHIPVTLFLNKKDLFEKKLETSAIERYFPDFKGKNTLKYGTRYFEKKFRSTIQTKGEEADRAIVTHVTCCTDTTAMGVIIVSVLLLAPRQRSNEIDAQIAADKIVWDRIRSQPRILVLGSGDSGKSTFLKQLKILHGGGFSDDERRAFRVQIIGNIVDAIGGTIAVIRSLGLPIRSADVQAKISSLGDQLAMTSNLKPCEQLSSEMLADIESLWADADFQAAFRECKNLQDTAGYFLSQSAKFASDDYLPTDKDILHARLPTTQITETVFKIDNKFYRFFDVGGQQKHRKQWAPYFDDVHNIVFVASLSSYDQKLVEDPTINRMHDALNLFGQICNSPILKHVSITLMLNKKDIFEEKIKVTPINSFFPDYQGPPELKKGGRFFEKKFLAQNQQPEKRLWTHVTCCTDTKAMEVIIVTVLTTMLAADLKGNGFM
ncbi:hypothetical protein HK105_203784 [Polyrhizophydium stewartii]|uniref:Uncharacterized protein n=1 Tax=Polyrhizophydium stewartii TaxID=2732419 RepID=A0ABR4NAW6_9FUNG